MRVKKLWKYLICFSLVTLLTGIVNVETIFAYIVIVSSMMIFLKYIVKLKITLYDMLFILIMIFLKLGIELIFFIIFNNLLNIFLFYLSFQVLKVIIVLLLRNKINQLYKFLKIKWDENFFYIRYIFAIFMFLYSIFSCLYLIAFY